MAPLENRPDIYSRPAELLQQLIRFDTTNPPGHEAECIGYMQSLLASAGIPTSILAQDPARPNLIARLAGRGDAPPLLVYAHVDVVPTANQTWQVPPFEGGIVDGVLWGRGTLDDKGGAAMSLSALLRAKAENLVPAGDVVLAMLCDEETGGGYGAKYLVQNHPDQFAGIRYALAEVGGLTSHVAGRRFYPIMVAEKPLCLLQASVRGPVRHAFSGVVRDGAAARLGRLLARLDKARLPVHVTPVVRQMFEVYSSNLSFPAGMVFRLLLRPALAGQLSDLVDPRGELLYPLLHNVVNVTRIQGGEQIAGTPAVITAGLAASLLPGLSPEDLLAELRPIAGQEVELEVTVVGETGPERPDMGLFDTLAGILREADPQGVPMPLLLNSPTDARTFARLGIQTYGFQPMNLPLELNIAQLAHGPDKRIPVKAVEFGAEAIYQALQRFGTSSTTS